MTKIAVIRIAGLVGKSGEVNHTLDMLHLKQKFACTVVENTPTIFGMIKKLEPFVTYGEITDETYKSLVEKRGEKTKEGLKPFFRLHPPRKGFERKGTKQHFNVGGAYGNRGEKINDLLKRMI